MKSKPIKQNVKIIFIILSFVFISNNPCHSLTIDATYFLALNPAPPQDSNMKQDWSYTIGRDPDANFTVSIDVFDDAYHVTDFINFHAAAHGLSWDNPFLAGTDMYFNKGVPSTLNHTRDFVIGVYNSDGTLTLHQGSSGTKMTNYYTVDQGGNNVGKGVWFFIPKSYVEPKFGKVTHEVESFASAVPETSTMLLLGVGLVGLAGIGRKRFKK